MTKLRKRPRDPNQLGKLVVDIAAGQVEDQAETKPVHEGKSAGGRKGGRARAQALSSGARSRIASLAAKARWAEEGR